MSDLTFGIKLTADGKQLVGAIRVSREEFDKLGLSTGKAGGAAKQFGTDSEEASKRAAAGYGKARDGADSLAVQLNRLKGLALGYIGVSQLVGFTKSLIESTVAMDGFSAKMSIALGSIKNVSAEYEYLRQLSNRLGTEVRSTADAYASFAAAARGTALEGAKAREVFTGVATASARMSLTADAQQGVFLALSQMMSKGVVSAEEFRQQLGERLPVATTAGAAALGVTTAEFVKLLNSGKLLSEEFLPKFAAQLEKMAGGGGPVDNLQASLNRLSNNWTDFYQSVSKSAALKDGADWFAGLASGATDVAKAVNRAQQEYGTLIALLAGIGFSMAKVAGVELDPQKRAQADLNDMLKEQLALKRDISILSARSGTLEAEKATKARADLAELNARIKAQIDLVNAPVNEAGAAAAKRRDDEGAQAAARAAFAKKTLSEEQLKAIEDEKKAYDSLIVKLNAGLVNASAAAQAAQHGYNNAQAEALKMFESPAWAKMDERQRMEVAGKLEATIALERELEARKKLQKQVEDSAKGGAILGRLGGDFDAESSKKNRALNDATMSAADKQHADNLDTVAQRAAKAREELAKLGITEEARAQLLVSVDQVEAEQIRRMEELRQQVEKNNASWEYGANVALRNYRDEAGNVAKQSESLFTKAFKGAEDAVTKFAMTGKLSIRDFAQTVIEEFVRINVSRPMVSAGAGMLGDLFGVVMGSMAAPGSANDVLVMMGAGRASGGEVYPNTLHPVNERGPELLNYGGSDYLMMGGRGGYVKPLTSAGGGAPSSSGGTVIHLTNAPVINIDSRSDQAQVRQLVQSAVQQGNAQLVDKLHRQGVL